jgi:hypothetical protein
LSDNGHASIFAPTEQLAIDVGEMNAGVAEEWAQMRPHDGQDLVVAISHAVLSVRHDDHRLVRRGRSERAGQVGNRLSSRV